MITLDFANIAKQIDNSRVIIKVLLAVGSEDFLASLDTYLLKDSDTIQFFEVLDEKIKKGMSTESSENIFISLMNIHHYDYDQLDYFLKVIKKTPSYLVEKLLQKDNLVTIDVYIDQIKSKSRDPQRELEDIIPILTSQYMGNPFTYLRLATRIISVSPKFIDALLNGSNHFSSILLNNGLPYTLVAGDDESRILAAKNYSLYLLEQSEEDFKAFDEFYISYVASAYALIEYAGLVPTSNKRSILRRLVDMKDEEALVVFIKGFPEYSHLLPLL